jgi:hypothetical protein
VFDGTSGKLLKQSTLTTANMVMWVAAPVDKVGTSGSPNPSVAGQISRDGNWFYICITGGASGAQVWKRSAIATNW